MIFGNPSKAPEHINKIFVNVDEFSGEYCEEDKIDRYEPQNDIVADIEGFGHGGSDFYSMWHFVEKVRGNKDADTIDVYEAMDMFLPGMFAYRSILKGGIPVEIPDLRDKNVREQWRNDTACTDPKVAGDMLLPTFSKGTPDIDDGVYEYMKKLWEAECNSDKETYRNAVMNVGIKK